MRRLYPILALLFVFSFVEKSKAQTVSNVDFQQEDDFLAITYNLQGDITKAFISLYVSIDGGATFKGPLTSAKGDIGPGVLPGDNKKILWNVLDEMPGLSGTIVFDVRARIDDEKKPVVKEESSGTQSTELSGKLSGVEVGSGRNYKIILKSGFEIKGRIVRAEGQKFTIMTTKGKVMSVNTEDVAYIDTIGNSTGKSFGSIGMGIGIPYGIFGMNMEINVIDWVSLTAAIGTGIWVNPMYNVGVRGYFTPRDKKFRPRATVEWGTYGMLFIAEDSYTSGNYLVRKSYTGVTLGAGMQYALKTTRGLAFDIDIIYIVDDSELEDDMEYYEDTVDDFDIQATGNIKISLGIRYVF